MRKKSVRLKELQDKVIKIMIPSICPDELDHLEKIFKNVRGRILKGERK